MFTIVDEYCRYRYGKPEQSAAISKRYRLNSIVKMPKATKSPIIAHSPKIVKCDVEHDFEPISIDFDRANVASRCPMTLPASQAFAKIVPQQGLGANAIRMRIYAFAPSLAEQSWRIWEAEISLCRNPIVCTAKNRAEYGKPEVD